MLPWWLRRTSNNVLKTVGTRPGASLVTAAVTSTALGYLCFLLVVGQSNETPSLHPRSISHEEARLRAMVENAQQSSFQENLENAVQAQEQFMLPGRSRERPEFIEKINRRADEIMKEQEQQKKLARKGSTTTFWK
jgi:hypothetical protein